MMNKTRAVLWSWGCLVMALSIVANAHAGEEGDNERAIEYRQAVMNVMGWNMKPMGAMMKDKMPYDAAAFARHAKDLASAASVDLISGFPEDSDAGETDALPDIWLDFEDFKQKFQNLQNSSNNLNEAVSAKDQGKIKAAFAELGKACKACHKAYKD